MITDHAKADSSPDRTELYVPCGNCLITTSPFMIHVPKALQLYWLDCHYKGKYVYDDTVAIGRAIEKILIDGKNFKDGPTPKNTLNSQTTSELIYLGKILLLIIGFDSNQDGVYDIEFVIENEGRVNYFTAD
jgi:hypothetical protein